MRYDEPEISDLRLKRFPRESCPQSGTSLFINKLELSYFIVVEICYASNMLCIIDDGSRPNIFWAVKFEYAILRRR
jgi:hypothetical protein